MTRLRMVGAFALAGSLIFTVHSHAAVVTGGTGPGGIGFTDGSSSLQGWFKAETITGGPSVATWSDSSGKAHHATQGTSGMQPQLVGNVLNSTLPVVRFDGTNDFLAGNFGTGTYSGDQKHTVVGLFAVRQFIHDAGNNTLVGIGHGPSNPANRQIMGLNFEHTFETHNRLQGKDVDHTTNLGTSFHSFSNLYPGGGVIYELNIDGVLQTPASQNNSSTHNFDSGLFHIGDSVPPQSGSGSITNSNFIGDAAELGFFNRALNNAEQIVTDNYLSAKYDVPLNTGGGAVDVYAGDDGANGDYDSDVFGIGQVDGSNQVVTTGAAGFGIEVTGGLDNNEWAFAGHKVATNSLVAIEGFASGHRWDRVWYVDITGALDPTFGFDFSDGSLTPPGAEDDFGLLYSPTNDFDWSLAASGGSLAADLVSFSLAGVDDSNDGYYTLAINAVIPEPGTLLIWSLLAGLGIGVRWRRRRTK